MSDVKDFAERAEWLQEELRRLQPSAARAHPDDEELGAYAEGGLAAGRRSEIAEHLLTCPECARTVLDLADAGELPEAAEAGEIEASWQRFRPRLAETGVLRPEPSPGAVVPFRRTPAVRSSRWAALAASLLVALLGSSVLNVVQWQRTNQPQGIAQTVTLRPVRGSAETFQWLSPGQTFELRLDADERTGPQRIEILRADRSPFYSIAVLRNGDVYAVTLPASRLRPGLYWARFAAPPGKPASEPIGFQVVRAPSDGSAETSGKP